MTGSDIVVLNQVAGSGSRGPDVGKAGGERGQAEPEPIRGAVIRDDVRRVEPGDDLLGLSPLTTRFTDVWTAVGVARDIIETKRWDNHG